MQTKQATAADFAFLSADTKLGGFDWSFFSAIPLYCGLGFAFGLLCEILIAPNRLGEGTLISDVSGQRHSSARSLLNQLERDPFFPIGPDFYLFEGLGKNNLIGVNLGILLRRQQTEYTKLRLAGGRNIRLAVINNHTFELLANRSGPVAAARCLVAIV
jgi:hypothetical protein